MRIGDNRACALPEALQKGPELTSVTPLSVPVGLGWRLKPHSVGSVFPLELQPWRPWTSGEGAVLDTCTCCVRPAPLPSLVPPALPQDQPTSLGLPGAPLPG